jgi:hypothetical protein
MDYGIAIIIIIVTISLILLTNIVYKRNITTENYTDIAYSLLSDNTKSTISNNLSKQLNTPCMIKTKEGNNFEFKVDETQLGWFATPDQPNTCSLDLNSDDISNNSLNCSSANKIINDIDYKPNLVSSVYWNDMPENKRCEVKFNNTPSTADLTNYMKRQESYKILTDCQKAIIKAAELKEQKAVLQKELADSINKEEAKRQAILELNRGIANSNAKVEELEADKRRLINDIDNLRIQLANKKAEIVSANKQVADLKILIENTRNNYEGKLLQDKFDMAQQVAANAKALADQHAADLAVSNAQIKAKNDEIAILDSRKNAAEAKKTVYMNDIVVAQTQQQTINNNIKATDVAIQQALTPPAPPPVNCIVTDWSGWSGCINGQRSRNRSVNTYAANGGTACPNLTETETCAMPVNCEVGEWSEWSACANGQQSRSRNVNKYGANGGSACPNLTESRSCAMPVNCQVGGWSGWSGCANGQQSRTRGVTVNPANGGYGCPSLSETQSCAMPVNCQVGGWSDWSECGPDSRQTHSRGITVNSANGGAGCPPLTESQGCVYTPKQAVLYRDCNYGGGGVTLRTGDYRVQDLKNSGIRNDDISSIRLQGGATATLYRDDNFRSPTISTGGDISCFAGYPYNFNDALSSIKIY